MLARTAIAVSPVLLSAFSRKPPDYSTTGAVNPNNTFCLCVNMPRKSLRIKLATMTPAITSNATKPIQFRIRCDTRSYFNVSSKADISQFNLPHGTEVKKWKREKPKRNNTDTIRSIGKQSTESVESVQSSLTKSVKALKRTLGSWNI